MSTTSDADGAKTAERCGAAVEKLTHRQEVLPDSAEQTTRSTARLQPGVKDPAPFHDLRRIGRGLDGRFMSGNLAALRTGRHTRRLSARPELQAEIAARAAAIVDDLGGPSAVGPVLRDLSQVYAEVAFLRDSLGKVAVQFGPVTATGRTRAITGAYTALIDRQLKLAAALGLSRVPRPAADPENETQAALQEAIECMTDEERGMFRRVLERVAATQVAREKETGE